MPNQKEYVKIDFSKSCQGLYSIETSDNKIIVNVEKSEINFWINIDGLNKDVVLNFPLNFIGKLNADIKANGGNADAVMINFASNSQVKLFLFGDFQKIISKKQLVVNTNGNSRVSIYGYYQGSVSDSSLSVNALGRGADIDIKLLAITTKKEELCLNVFTSNFAKDTTIKMSNIAIAAQFSKLNLNAVQEINNSFNNSAAYQRSRGLITSNHASIIVNPILLVKEYDVQAGHAATIGCINDDELFYIMARGLDKDEAIKLIVEGVIKPFTMLIDNDELLGIIEKKMKEVV